MDIQAFLGVEIVDEKEQQKIFLREKISQSIKISDSARYLNFPIVADIPVLSSQSVHDLANELAAEVKNSQRHKSNELSDQKAMAKAHIQLNFLRYLNNNNMKCHDMRTKKVIASQHIQEDSESQSNKRVKRAKRQSKPSRTFGLTNTVVFKKPPVFLNGGGINIQDKEEFNNSIDQLMEEALFDNMNYPLEPFPSEQEI